MIANARRCPPVPPPNLHGKEGVVGSSPTEGLASCLGLRSVPGHSLASSASTVGLTLSASDGLRATAVQSGEVGDGQAVGGPLKVREVGLADVDLLADLDAGQLPRVLVILERAQTETSCGCGFDAQDESFRDRRRRLLDALGAPGGSARGARAAAFEEFGEETTD